jgi:hypothetical protein
MVLRDWKRSALFAPWQAGPVLLLYNPFREIYLHGEEAADIKLSSPRYPISALGILCKTRSEVSRHVTTI